MNYIISMFIDNELDIDEKIDFIETVRKDRSFTDEALELLYQEKLVRGRVVEQIPPIDVKVPFEWKRFLRPLIQPMGLIASTLAAAVIFLVFSLPSPTYGPITKRFVIYRPDVDKIEITGSFTNWKRIPMHKIGTSGYWDITLELIEGEHRFTYILEDGRSFADPTILAREPDDFGGENSIFYIESRV